MDRNCSNFSEHYETSWRHTRVRFGEGMKQRKAFTLIELLTVIAIIAILAAIIVPVFARAKVSALRNGDIANMNQLSTALGLYRADQGAYPPQLLGYVTLYSSGPQAGNVIPATALKGYIFPQNADSLNSFKPAYNSFSNTTFTGALGTDSGVVFPPGDATAVGSSPIMDLNGDGVISGLDDTLGSRQAYGPGDGSVCWHGGLGAIVAGGRCGEASASAVNFYRLSGYDVFEAKIPGGGTRNELRYARFWSNFTIGLSPFGNGSAIDDPRQLGYSDPPDDTVITWNSVYREFDGSGNVKPGRQEIGLTLGGSARPLNSVDYADFAWRQRR